MVFSRMVSGAVLVGGAALLVACSGGGSDATGIYGPPPPTGQQVGTVQGQVIDTTDAPVAGAAVTLTATGYNLLSTTTGADGHYTFTSVPVGAWAVTVSPPSAYTVSGSATQGVTVTSGGTASADFRLQRTPPQVQGIPVAIRGFAFSPATDTVAVGSTVTWTNGDAATHTVTADSAGFDSGSLPNGRSYSQVFNTAGTFTYHCAIHATMKGTIVVR